MKRDTDASSVTLRVLAEELPRRQIDMWPVLRKYGFSRAQFYNPLARVPRPAVLAFVEHCVELTNDRAYHLHATAHAKLGAFGMLDFIAMMAPTIGVGFTRVSRAYSLVNPSLAILPQQVGRFVHMRLRSTIASKPHWIDSETLAVAAASRLREASGGRTLVAATFSGVDRGYTPLLEKLLSCPVTWGSTDLLIYNLADWNLQPQHFHPALTAILSGFSQAGVGASDLADISDDDIGHSDANGRDLIDSVNQVIAAKLLHNVSATEAAQSLGLTTRTLQRRLAQHGTSFADLVDQMRHTTARTYVDQGEMSVTAMASALGFSDDRAFLRAFKRWTGTTPAAQRKAKASAP